MADNVNYWNSGKQQQNFVHTVHVKDAYCKFVREINDCRWTEIKSRRGKPFTLGIHVHKQ